MIDDLKIEDIIKKVHDAGMFCGVSIKPGTPVEKLWGLFPLFLSLSNHLFFIFPFPHLYPFPLHSHRNCRYPIIV